MIKIALARELLGEHDVLQYFFPAPDQLALGIIERASASPTDIVDQIALAPSLGHPLGEMELVARGTSLPEIMDALKERGFVVDGEIAQELTAEGESRRASVRFTPKEGVISKLINRVSITIDISTWFFGGG